MVRCSCPWSVEENTGGRDTPAFVDRPVSADLPVLSRPGILPTDRCSPAASEHEHAPGERIAQSKGPEVTHICRMYQLLRFTLGYQADSAFSGDRAEVQRF